MNDDLAQIKSEIGLEIADDYINLKLHMRGFPPHATDRAKVDSNEFVRAIQDAVIEFLGSSIDRVEVRGTLKHESNEKQSETKIQQMQDELRRKVRSKDRSLN